MRPAPIPIHCSPAGRRSLRTPRLVAVSDEFILAVVLVSHRTDVPRRRAVRSTAESSRKG